MTTAAANDPLRDATRDATMLLHAGRFETLPRFDDPEFAAARVAFIPRAFA